MPPSLMNTKPAPADDEPGDKPGRPLDRYDAKVEGGKLLLGRLRQATENRG